MEIIKYTQLTQKRQKKMEKLQQETRKQKDIRLKPNHTRSVN